MRKEYGSFENNLIPEPRRLKAPSWRDQFDIKYTMKPRTTIKGESVNNEQDLFDQLDLIAKNLRPGMILNLEDLAIVYINAKKGGSK